MFRMNKRAQGESGGASFGLIVGIILIGILLFLVVAFVIPNWTGVTESIANYFSPGSSLDSAIAGCKASATGAGAVTSSSSFCTELKKVKYGGTTQYATCAYLDKKEGLGLGVVCSTAPTAKAQFVASCTDLKRIPVTINGVEVKDAAGCSTSLPYPVV